MLMNQKKDKEAHHWGKNSEVNLTSYRNKNLK